MLRAIPNEAWSNYVPWLDIMEGALSSAAGGFGLETSHLHKADLLAAIRANQNPDAWKERAIVTLISGDIAHYVREDVSKLFETLMLLQSYNASVPRTLDSMKVVYASYIECPIGFFMYRSMVQLCIALSTQNILRHAQDISMDECTQFLPTAMTKLSQRALCLIGVQHIDTTHYFKAIKPHLDNSKSATEVHDILVQAVQGYSATGNKEEFCAQLNTQLFKQGVSGCTVNELMEIILGYFTHGSEEMFCEQLCNYVASIESQQLTDSSKQCMEEQAGNEEPKRPRLM
jgi:hypothetical protein